MTAGSLTFFFLGLCAVARFHFSKLKLELGTRDHGFKKNFMAVAAWCFVGKAGALLEVLVMATLW